MKKTKKLLPVLVSLLIMTGCGQILNTSTNPNSQNPMATSVPSTVSPTTSDTTAPETTASNAPSTSPLTTGSPTTSSSVTTSQPTTTSSEPSIVPPSTPSSTSSPTPSVPSSTPVSSSSSSQTPTTPVSTPEPKKTMADFNKALKDSQPSTVIGIWKFNYATLGLTLNATTTLKIEYGTALKASYSVSKDVLNKIGSEEMVSKKKETYYAQGKNYGALQEDGSIDWVESAEKKFDYNSYQLQNMYFESSDIEENVFTGNFRDSLLPIFFDDDSIAYTDMVMKLTMNDTRKIDSLNLSFVNNKKAKVTLDAYYSYDAVTVTIPV